MDILLRLSPLIADDLTKYTGPATASVTSLIDRLKKKGLARRIRAFQPGRSIHLIARQPLSAGRGGSAAPRRSKR